MTAWLCNMGRAFRCAFAGLAWMLRTQRNARIHLLAASAVTAAGFWLEISRTEACVLALACGAVLAAEALNTALEQVADAITTRKDERIRRAKDVAAAGVLVAAVAAAIVGLIVFVPHLCGKL